MKRCFRIGSISIIVLWLAVSSVKAGTLKVVFSAQNVQHTLLTLHEQQIEFVHVNKVAELFQLELQIDPPDGRVVLRYDNKSASFFPGQQSVIADRRSHFLDTPPILVEGVLMVPVEFLTKILPLIYEYDIVWDAAQKTLLVGIHNLEIFDLYSSPYGNYTRIAVDINQVTPYKITETLPSMVIFELPHSQFQLSQNPLQVNSRSVKQVKVIDSFGSTQLIIRLGPEFVRYTHQIVEDPPRLLIDVYNTQETLVNVQSSEGISEQDLSAQAEQDLSTARQFALRTVVLDPGHGGSDQGIFVAPASEDSPEFFEKQLTLYIAELLGTSLNQRLGVRVIFTREGNDFISSETRTTIANSNRADIFLSLHVNNSAFGDLSGFEVYVMDYGSLELPVGYSKSSAQSQLLDYAQAKYIALSEQLAQQIVSAYIDRNENQRAVVKRAPLFTLKGATMPAVHVEIGYGSHEQDRMNILQEEFQQVIVAAITDGIAMFRQEAEQ